MFCCVVYFMFWTWSSCITGPVCKVSSHNNVIGLLKTTHVYIIGLLKPTNYNGISLFKPTGLNKLFACNVTSFFIFSLSTLYRSFIFFIKFDFRQPWFSGRSSLTCVMRTAQLWHLMLKYFAWNNYCMKYISKQPKWFFFHILLLLLEFFLCFLSFRLIRKRVTQVLIFYPANLILDATQVSSPDLVFWQHLVGPTYTSGWTANYKKHSPPWTVTTLSVFFY